MKRILKRENNKNKLPLSIEKVKKHLRNKCLGVVKNADSLQLSWYTRNDFIVRTGELNESLTLKFLHFEHKSSRHD